MIGELFGVLGSLLSIWEHKEKTKYLDQYVKLKREYREATNKPENEWDDLVVANIEFELRLISRAVVLSVGEPGPSDKPVGSGA